ncbi:MAG: 50S ribosomal protein L22 [Bacteroidota bacterium]
MEARAVSKYIRSSPRKMRIVANVVREMPVTKALNTLHFMPNKAARFIERTIQSAVHNLMDVNADERVNEEELVVRTIHVDQAPMFKRIQPVSRGRAHRIRKRNSHLTVVVGLPDAAEDDA